MILSAEERTEVEILLASCGIEGEDLRTSLDRVCEFAGDVTLPELVAELKSMQRDTVAATVDELVGKFGHDAARAARVIQVRMP